MDSPLPFAAQSSAGAAQPAAKRDVSRWVAAGRAVVAVVGGEGGVVALPHLPPALRPLACSRSGCLEGGGGQLRAGPRGLHTCFVTAQRGAGRRGCGLQRPLPWSPPSARGAGAAHGLPPLHKRSPRKGVLWFCAAQSRRRPPRAGACVGGGWEGRRSTSEVDRRQKFWQGTCGGGLQEASKKAGPHPLASDIARPRDPPQGGSPEARTEG